MHTCSESGVASLAVQRAMDEPEQPWDSDWEYKLRKYLLLLATLVVTVTYAAGFNPPGGNWQQASVGRLAGDPIIRDTDYHRYLAFFYCNATAFAASLVVIVLILIHAISHDKEKEEKEKEKEKGKFAVPVVKPLRDVMEKEEKEEEEKEKEKEKGKFAVPVVKPLRAVMVLDLLSLVCAYGAGACRDRISIVYSAVLVAAVFLYIAVPKLTRWWSPEMNSESGSGSAMPESMPDKKKLKAEERLRKVLMLLATFAVSITYVAGLSTPGGFWDSTEGSHRPGDPILKDHHSLRLTVFLLCNTTAFMASLFITMLLIINGKKPGEKTAGFLKLYTCIIVALVGLVGLVGAYAAGSCRETDTTAYVVSLVGAVLAYILLHRCYTSCCPSRDQQTHDNDKHKNDNDKHKNASTNTMDMEALDKARSLVLLLATLAATITYTAGLDPPGGLWQDNTAGHMAGDPILLTTDPRRYKAFFYCNSVALVASLVAIVLVRREKLVKHHVLEAAMILNLFGLIGAYAAGSCRDVSTSIYAMALAGAVLVYVVIHVVFFTLDHQKDKQGKEENRLLEKRRKRLLLFAILTATITYQAGLTPPGGFVLDNELGHHAGDPVLLYNFPRRYNTFFYCNSVSFMLSIALILLLVNPNLYRPAIRSNALSVCTAVGLLCLIGAYAAGSTQHLKTSIYIFVLVGVVLFVAAGLLLVFLSRELKKNGKSTAIEQEGEKGEEEEEEEEEERKKHARRKYLMLLGILVASVTYQAGLEPPGGAWQTSGNRYNAGYPVMHDNRRPQYLAFFYSNSTSFVASIIVIILLLPHWLLIKKEEKWEKWSLSVMKMTIILDLVALLVAYAAGSSRGWKTSVYVVALIIAVLGYFAIHMTLSLWSERHHENGQSSKGHVQP